MIFKKKSELKNNKKQKKSLTEGLRLAILFLLNLIFEN